MKLTGPNITIRNTDSGSWLVSMQDMLGSDVETISFSVLIDRRDEPVTQTARRGIRAAIAHLEVLAMAPDQPGIAPAPRPRKS